MPEYLAPGVYVEEVSFRSKTIEGVSTTTTGFVGPTRYGPVDREPELLTSLADYERHYGGGQDLNFAGSATPNFMWHAVRGFFAEGGRRLYVARVYRDPADATTARAKFDTATAPHATVLRARHFGLAGAMRVRFALRLGANVLVPAGGGNAQLMGVRDRELVHVAFTIGSTAHAGLATVFFDVAAGKWRLESSAGTVDVSAIPTTPGHAVRVVTLDVTIPNPPSGEPAIWSGLALDPRLRQAGARRDAAFMLGAAADPLVPIEFHHTGVNHSETMAVLEALAVAAGDTTTLAARLDALATNPDAAPAQFEVALTGGSDGQLPGDAHYFSDSAGVKRGLRYLEDLEDISIVAAPGSTHGYSDGDTRVNPIIATLIRHAERMKYRVAVVDSGNAMSVGAVRAMRARFDSKHAAFYYPWVTVSDPVTGAPLNLPPSGFVAGIYARNDVNRAVYKAPANEVVSMAAALETTVNSAQQEVLNPEGINCLRFFEGRGFRVWGARTMSSDPEWKYLNLRRYFAYLERSIDRGTQWAVFEPNGELLWANVRRTIEDFLLNEWQSGALLGDRAEKAYFVRCDRSTMTQNDLDNGRLVCQIGVAPVRPAEFVIFRVGQWTTDRKN